MKKFDLYHTAAGQLFCSADAISTKSAELIGLPGLYLIKSAVYFDWNH